MLLGISGNIFGQVLRIESEATGQAVPFATIVSQSPAVSVTSDLDGQADVSTFAGSEALAVSALGFETRVISFATLQAARFTLKLVPASLNLDEVVVAATRWRQNAKYQPAKVISISPQEVALQNPQTAADLLGLSGKVYVQKSQQGGGSPMIRGFATNRLLYIVDGVRMNNAIFRGGNLQNVINLDPFAVENTEVLFGPGSVIYGSDAIGGVMSFNTLTPTFSTGSKPSVNGKVITRFSSANQEKTGHLDVNLGWEKWALVSSVSYWNFDHLRQGSNGPDDYLKPYYVQRVDGVDQVIIQDDPLLQIPSAYDQLNLLQKIRFKPGENWNLEYGFHYSETSPYGRYDRHNRTRNGTARYAEWDYGPQSWQMHHLEVINTGKTVASDQLTLRLAKQTFGESRIDRTLNRTERNTQAEAVDAYSLNLDAKKALGKKHQLLYGAEYVRNDVTSTGLLTDISTNVSEVGPARYPQADWSSVGAYLTDEYQLNDKLSLQAGLRYNQFILNADFSTDFYPFPFTDANIDNGALTGSLGGTYRPSESWVLRANFGTAFRAPNVDDIGKVFDSEPGAVTIPNPALGAEYAWNFDFGLAKVFGERAKIELSTYYTILENALVRRNFQLNGQDSIFYDGELSQVQAIQNAAVARVYGVQAGLEVRLFPHLTLSSDLNYQQGEEELDDGTTSPSRHAAPLFGITRLHYKTGKLNLQLNAAYQGERTFEHLAPEEQGKDEIYAKDENGNNYAPAWYTLNLKARYDLTKSLSLGAGVENITDQRYRPYSSGISGAGRNFVGSLRVEF